MDFMTPKIRNFTKIENIKYHPELKMWETDGKFFDTIFSLITYLGMGSQYENFMMTTHPHWAASINERKKFLKFEEDYIQIDALFNRLPNLSKSKTNKDMYRFHKDTELTFKNRKYDINNKTKHTKRNRSKCRS